MVSAKYPIHIDIYSLHSQRQHESTVGLLGIHLFGNYRFLSCIIMISKSYAVQQTPFSVSVPCVIPRPIFHQQISVKASDAKAD